MKVPGIAMLCCYSLLVSQVTQTAHKIMPSDRWGSQPFGGPVRYPKLAAMARISGDVITAIVINRDGEVDQIKSLTGPVQLRATAESMVKSIKFSISPSDGEGPWLFFVTSEFNLNKNKVFCFATPKDKIPFDLLKKPPTPNPAPASAS